MITNAEPNLSISAAFRLNSDKVPTRPPHEGQAAAPDQGISIVNGAQTTGSLSSLAELLPPDLQVAIRFVKANKHALVANVVRYNNSQNKIQAADFRSTDAIQERLRTEFDAIPDAEYEGGRRGGASDAIKRSKFTLPFYTVGQSLAAFHGDPVTAYDKKSELWTNERITGIFSQTEQLLVISCSVIRF